MVSSEKSTLNPDEPFFLLKEVTFMSVSDTIIASIIGVVGVITATILTYVFTVRSSRLSDKEILRLYQSVFDRRAFRGLYQPKTDQEPFRKVIKDSILAINTGFRRTRSGDPLTEQAKGIRHIKNSKSRKKLRIVVGRLNRIISILDAGRDSESLLFRARSFKNSGALVDYLMNPQYPIYAYLIDQFSDETRKLVAEYNRMDKQTYPRGSIPVSNEFQMALANDLNSVIKSRDLYDEKRFAQIDIKEDIKQLIKENPDGEDLIRMNRYLLDKACMYIIPATLEEGIDRERDEIIKTLNSIWESNKQLDCLPIPTESKPEDLVV